jgi:membrane protein
VVRAVRDVAFRFGGFVKDVFVRCDRHGVTSRASNFAFSAFVGTVPVLFVLVSLIGLLTARDTYESLLNEFGDRIPADVEGVLRTALAAASSTRSATIFLVLGIVGGLWQAGNVIGVVLGGIEEANGTPGRPWVRNKVVSLAVAAAVAVAAVLATLAAVNSSQVVDWIGRLAGAGADTRDIAQQAVLWTGRAALVGFVLVAYRFGPRVPGLRWRDALPGAIVASAGWFVVTWAFGLYLTHFGNYNVIYGSLGAIVVYLTFLWLTGLLLFVGAEINAALLERRGRSRPVLDARGADRAAGVS